MGNIEGTFEFNPKDLFDNSSIVIQEIAEMHYKSLKINDNKFRFSHAIKIGSDAFKHEKPSNPTNEEPGFTVVSTHSCDNCSRNLMTQEVTYYNEIGVKNRVYLCCTCQRELRFKQDIMITNDDLNRQISRIGLLEIEEKGWKENHFCDICTKKIVYDKNNEMSMYGLKGQNVDIDICSVCVDKYNETK